jgi:hydroxyacylglutathione hydrolase
LLKNKASNHIAIVDPGESGPVLQKIESEGLIPVAILITHHHWDHVNGIADITAKYDIPVYTPKTESVSGSTQAVAEGDTVVLDELDLTLNILDVPGHTSGAVAYYSDEMVFSGDTLFAAGCGRLFEGTPAQMHTSLSKFKALSDDTLIYCGHEYTVANLQFAATVEPDNQAIQERLLEAQKLREKGQPTVPSALSTEKQTNPFLRCDIDSVIAAASQHSGKKLSAEQDVFAAVRKWKDSF